jgi:hypothetical protein
LCRTNIIENIIESNIEQNASNKKYIDEQWIINPETKRRVKIGSRTYKRLVQEGVITI